MLEIAALPPNGYTVVSTFSGCGGSCLGFKIAGYRIAWASEFVPAAQDVYRRNHPNTVLDIRDIRQVTAGDIFQATGLKAGELDVFEGSPPCASFSTAGKREATWGKTKVYSDTKQRTDDLFFEYARLLRELQPKVFVAENVSGLVKGTAKGYFKIILRALRDCGYVVEVRLLDAQWLGVPQMRQRLIFQGVRIDLGLSPSWPKPLPYRYSVRDALPWIVRQGDNGPFGAGAMRRADGEPSGTIGTGPQAGNGRFPPSIVDARIEGANGYNGHASYSVDQPMATVQQSRSGRIATNGSRAYRDKRGAFGHDGDITDQPAPTVLSDSVGTHWIEPEADISRYAIGAEWNQLRPGERSDRYFQLKRLTTEQPSDTITQRGGDRGVAAITHPTERRKFSIAELKRICAFPDDFILTGTYAQQWERLGRAVPPIMMRAVAERIRDDILERLP